MLRLGKAHSEIAPNEFHEFLVKLVNYRSKTIELKVGKSKYIIAAHRQLYLNLSTYPKRRQEVAAIFFLKNLSKIEELLPGQSSKAHNSFSCRLSELKSKALCITSNMAPQGGIA